MENVSVAIKAIWLALLDDDFKSAWKLLIGIPNSVRFLDKVDKLSDSEYIN